MDNRHLNISFNQNTLTASEEILNEFQPMHQMLFRQSQQRVLWLQCFRTDCLNGCKAVNLIQHKIQHYQASLLKVLSDRLMTVTQSEEVIYVKKNFLRDSGQSCGKTNTLHSIETH